MSYSSDKAEYKWGTYDKVSISGCWHVALDYAKCGYCGGNVIGSMKQVRSQVKRQPPPGAIDMNIYDEVTQTTETYLCMQCKYQYPEAASQQRGYLGNSYATNGVGLRLYHCHGICVAPEQACTRPDLAVALTTRGNVTQCTSCIECYVCDKALKTGEIMYATEETLSYGETYTRYHYSHVECSAILLAKVMAYHQNEQKKHEAMDKAKRGRRWW